MTPAEFELFVERTEDRARKEGRDSMKREVLAIAKVHLKECRRASVPEQTYAVKELIKELSKVKP